METSLPAPVFPQCFAMMIRMPRDKFLYLRGGHAKSEEYATFGEIGYREALTSSMHTRFFLVPSKEHGDEQLVHIKSSYNNKYLVAKETSRGVLVDTVDEPEEELNKASCTLFEIKEDDATKKARERKNMLWPRVRFVHPLTKKICYFLSKDIDRQTRELLENASSDVELADVAEQIILPPYVAFKGGNELYLRVRDIEGNPHLEFASKDKADASSIFTTLNYADGVVCIKSELNKKFLGLSEEWICADSEDIGAAEFRALKYGNFFALQSTRNGKFCIATKKANTDCLSAGSDNITDNTKLTLEEPVLSREIYNIEYHRNDHARIYDTTDMNMATASAINRTSEKNTVKSSLSITTTESSKWEATSTHKGNVSVSVRAGFKLFKVISANIQVQAGYEYSKATTWGTASQTEKKQEIEYEVTVPANKKVTLTVTSKQAKYDVPFSYTQRDRLHNGEPVIYNYDDGLYSGMNCFDLRYETKEEEIETKEEVLQSSKKRKGMTE